MHNTRRLVVVRPSGAVFAAIALPDPQTRVDGISSMLAVSPNTDAVAFTATRGNTAAASTGSETVYLLHGGARKAAPIHRERLTFAVCERAAQVAWHGNWLLYSASEGNTALVDARHPQHVVELRKLVRRLPGTSGDQGARNFSAYWTGDPTGV